MQARKFLIPDYSASRLRVYNVGCDGSTESKHFAIRRSGFFDFFTKMNTAQDFKYAVSQVQKLNPVAAVFARAHQLISSHQAQLEDIVEIVKLDTALTADIIRLSNSGALGSPAPTGSLQIAMVRVGLGEVDHYLGLSVSRSLMYRNLKCYGISAYEYWSSAVSTAILMELLARRLGEDQGEAYTVGILHGAGRLVIDQIINDLELSIYWDGITPIEQWEIESVGFTYATVGAHLLSGWGFPSPLCAIIENQSSPRKVADPSTLLKMLNFSSRVLFHTGVAFTVREWLMTESDPFMHEFKLSQKEVRDLVGLAKQKHGEAVISLGIVK